MDVFGEVEFQIADLEGSTLGLAFGNKVWIDADAAGFGWFVDETPWNDTEFISCKAGNELTAKPTSEAHGDMDLLTVVMHELGHVLGHDDVDAAEQNLMSETLGTGVRYLPEDAHPARSGANSQTLVSMHHTPEGETAPVYLRQRAYPNPWLVNFLTEEASKETESNDGILIVIDDEDEDTDDKGEKPAAISPSDTYFGRKR